MGKAELRCQLQVHVVKGQSTNWKSLKIQNFLRPGNQILAQKTMLWVFVCRTLTWCSQILKMWSIHTGEQVNNSKNPNRQRLRYISKNDHLPLLSLFACFHVKLREVFIP